MPAALSASRPRSPPASSPSRVAGGPLAPRPLSPRGYFPELTRLTGDRGARALFTRYRGDLVTVAFPDGDLDIDTPAAAAALDPD